MKTKHNKHEIVKDEAIASIKMLLISITGIFMFVLNAWVLLYFDYTDKLKSGVCNDHTFAGGFLRYLFLSFIISFIFYLFLIKSIGKSLQVSKVKKRFFLVEGIVHSLFFSVTIGYLYFFIRMLGKLVLVNCSVELWVEILRESIMVILVLFILVFLVLIRRFYLTKKMF